MCLFPSVFIRVRLLSKSGYYSKCLWSRFGRYPWRLYVTTEIQVETSMEYVHTCTYITVLYVLQANNVYCIICRAVCSAISTQIFPTYCITYTLQPTVKYCAWAFDLCDSRCELAGASTLPSTCEWYTTRYSFMFYSQVLIQVLRYVI